MSADIRLLLRQLSQLQVWTILPFVPPLIYLIALLLQLSWPEVEYSLIRVLVPDVLVVGFVLPWLYRRHIVLNAFREDPAEHKGERIRRLLELPRRIDFSSTATFAVGGGIYCASMCVLFHKSVWAGVAATALVVLSSLLTQLTSFFVVERWMQPHVLKEFHRDAGHTHSRASSLLWVRQRWYLPYAFFIVISFALFSATVIAWFHVHRAFTELATSSHVLTPEVVLARESALMTEMGLPAFGVFLYVLILAVFSARLLARRQEQGTAALEKTLQALARGESALPDWLATDELGDLAIAMAAVHERLRTFSRSLNLAALNLSSSAEQLEMASTKQTALLTRQIVAVQETHVTVQEIQQTSKLAADKATHVLNLAAQADSVRRTGGDALAAGLSGLGVIKTQVDAIANRVAGMGAWARQIGSITDTVKALADQSNMLALNAAIEATRAGEAGKGFGVVAREVRRLADESVRETHRVREILEDVSRSVRSAAEASAEGQRRIEFSLEQVRSTGTALQSLSEVVDANTAVARQIAATVGQQSAGVAQVFTAVDDLTRSMSETTAQLRENDAAIAGLKQISADVRSSTMAERSLAA